MGISGEYKLSRDALKCWYLRWLSAFILLLAFEVFSAIIATNLLYGLALTIIKTSAIAIPVLFGVALIFVPYFKFVNFSYSFNSLEIIIFSGFIIKTKQIISMQNIQHIVLKAYPFERVFKLATIKIFTAGSEHILQSIDVNHASLIQSFIHDRYIQ